MKKRLTLEQYIASCINEYPSLYKSSNYELSKFLVLDQTFNVLGNGLSHQVMMDETLCIPSVAYPNMPDEKYMSGETLYTGYTKTREIIPGRHMPEFDSEKVKNVLEEEKKLHPEIVHWSKDRLQELHAPYPNFQKEYSLIWKSVKDAGGRPEWMTDTWVDGASWFYQRCAAYFADYPYGLDKQFGGSGDPILYHFAAPEKNSREYNDFKARLEALKDGQTDQQWFDRVSKDYGFPFDGDFDAFFEGRWQKNRQEILNFVDETLGLLQDFKNNNNLQTSIKFKR